MTLPVLLPEHLLTPISQCVGYGRGVTSILSMAIRNTQRSIPSCPVVTHICIIHLVRLVTPLPQTFPRCQKMPEMPMEIRLMRMAFLAIRLMPT